MTDPVLPPGTPARLKRARIFRYRPGLWVVIARNYGTYPASTWRAAMDVVSPPSREYCGRGLCAYLEGHEGKCGT